jgi:hypothetical protein
VRRSVDMVCYAAMHEGVDYQFDPSAGVVIYSEIFKSSSPIAQMTKAKKCWLEENGLFVGESDFSEGSFVGSGPSVCDEPVVDSDSLSNREIHPEFALLVQNDSCKLQTHVSKCSTDLGQDLKFSSKKLNSNKFKKTEEQKLAAAKAKQLKQDRKHEKDAWFEKMKLYQDLKRQFQQAETAEDEQVDIELSSKQLQEKLMAKLYDLDIAIDCEIWENQAGLKLQFEQATTALRALQIGAEEEFSRVEDVQVEAELPYFELKTRSRAKRQRADKSQGRTPKLRCSDCHNYFSLGSKNWGQSLPHAPLSKVCRSQACRDVRADERDRKRGLKQNCGEPRECHRQRDLSVKEARRTKVIAAEEAFEVSDN